MRITVNGRDISAWVEKVTWSGDTSQIARKLSFTYGYTREDTNIPTINIDNGDTITADGIFVGVVINTSRQESSAVKTVTAIELSWYAGKVKTFGIYQGTPAQITAQVCGEYDISTGSLLQEGASTEIISTGEKTIYQVIEDAYNTVEHYVYMSGTALSVGKVGADSAGHLSGNTNVLDATYSSSIENMVNRVVVLDGNSAPAGQAEDAGNISRYGLMQETYKEEQGKDSAAEAEKLLQGIEESGNIKAQGNIACIAGKAVHITDVNSNITGRFNILSDTHTFVNDYHEMSLTLEYKG